MEIQEVSEVAAAEFKPKDLIQLHGAYKCMQREAKATSEKPWQCHVPLCREMRTVVKHMMSCTAERKCSWPNGCSSLRQEIKILTGCIQLDCPICMQRKEWQVSMSPEQRSNLVDLLVQTALSPKSTERRHDKILYAETIESEIYSIADNLTDYYRTMAAKKWDIEMDIEQRLKRLQSRHLERNILEERMGTRRRAFRLVYARYDNVHRRQRPNPRL